MDNEVGHPDTFCDVETFSVTVHFQMKIALKSLVLISSQHKSVELVRTLDSAEHVHPSCLDSGGSQYKILKPHWYNLL